MGRSTVCDCDISCSYSLNFLCERKYVKPRNEHNDLLFQCMMITCSDNQLLRLDGPDLHTYLLIGGLVSDVVSLVRPTWV